MASGLIWTPDERTTQPGIRSPLKPEYRNGFVILPSVGNAVEISRGRPLTDETTSTKIVDRYGVGLAISSNSGGYVSSGDSVSGVSGWTEATIVSVQLTPKSATAGWHNYLQGSGAEASHWTVSGLIYLSSLATARWVAGITPPVGADMLERVVITGKTGDHKAFINGALVASSTSSTFAIDRFAYGYPGTNTLVGNGYLLAVFPRAVSSSEALKLSQNPWLLFEADNDQVFYSLSSGSNNTATLSSTLEAATLAGVGSVTRSGTLAVTLDTATLTGIGGVTRSGTLSSTLADVTLTGIGGVARSGTLSVTLDAATLSGAGTVAVGTNRDGVLAVTLDNVTLAGVGAVTRSATLAVTLDNATLAGIGTAGQPRTGTLAVTLDNVTLSGVGAIPAAPSHGGGNGTGRNLSRKQKKKLKAVESQEWLKAEETARQLLNDRFTKQTPQEKAEALQTYVESLQPVIEALKALTTQIEEVKEVVEDAPIIELTPHQEILSRFDTLEKKLKSVEELVIILMADL